MLAETIKQRRTDLGLSQEELATRLSVVRQTVSKWEKGLSQPDVDMLVRLAQVLETTVADLVGETIDAPPPPPAPRKRAKALRTTLIVLGFPVWFSVLASLFAVVLSLYVSLWAIVLSLWAAVVSLWAAFGSLCICAFGCLLLIIVCGVTGHGVTALVSAAAALVCAGLAILWFFGCCVITKGMWWLTKWMARSTRIILPKREVAQ